VHELQHRLLAARLADQVGDLCLLLEHEPVVTLGRSAKANHVLAPRDLLAEMGVDLEETGRGGDVTFHGPGQLVGYPIMNLKPERCDLRRYVRSLAEVCVQILRAHDVEAGTVDGLIGVWVDRERPDEWAGAPWARELAKIGAIGVRVSRWATMHGFALNLDVDLAGFGLIVPCGITEHPVASLASLAGRSPSVREVALGAAKHLAIGLDVEVARVEDLSSVSDDDLFSALAPRAAPTESPAARGAA